MGFSEEMRRQCAEIWDTEHNHPLVSGIGDGTLELDKFRYYMRQDYIYLIDFCRVIALAAAKTQDVEDMGWFASLLDETLNTEMALHVCFCEDFGISEAELLATQPSPTTQAYTRFLLQTAYRGSIGEISCAILPCMWGYSEIGQMLYDRGLPEDAPLYTRWIEMYNSQEFAELAARMRQFLDRIAAECGENELERMREAFVTGSRYEYMFWDAAWRMEEWSV
ncbi:MAG: thiaminase II [Chloroflexi bacterium]|nr:thiaminase II [Chloroflexota bacterium]